MSDVTAYGGDGKVYETELIMFTEGDELLSLAEVICCSLHLNACAASDDVASFSCCS